MTADKNVALFKNMPAAVQELIEQIDPIDNLAGGNFGTNRRISIRGSVFREVVNGKETSTWDGRKLNVVVLNAAAVSRTFYAGKYKEGEVAAPTCWSIDCKTPDVKVKPENKQALRCGECPNNIKGSGEGDTRACRFGQRVAVLLADDIESRAVYQLPLPATSIFGDGVKDKLPMQAYARYLQAHRTPAVAIVTEMCLDTDSSTPKLTFKPVRPLEESELKIAIEMQKHEDTVRAITFTVSQMDGVKEETTSHLKPPATADELKEIEEMEERIEEGKKDDVAVEIVERAVAAKRRTAKAEEPAAPIPEPTKRQGKATAAVERVETKAKDLNDIIAEWADDDA